MRVQRERGVTDASLLNFVVSDGATLVAGGKADAKFDGITHDILRRFAVDGRRLLVTLTQTDDAGHTSTAIDG